MARCPFAIWQPISGSSGRFLGGPYKIVHHTTEGSTAAGAMEAFRVNRSDPHFTVDATRIYQHIDTAESARALKNPPGGVETNRDSAIQIELVGYAHLPKNASALTNVARLCRWIEKQHGVPNSWPSGPPKPAVAGKDPGGHRRDPATWDTVSGHYGHCHVPENTHWDPGYSASEVEFLKAATFDARGALKGERPAAPSRAPRRAKGPSRPARSTMPDHQVVPSGPRAYVRDLLLASDAFIPMKAAGSRARKAPSRRRAVTATTKPEAIVNVGSILSFVDGVDGEAKQDVLYSVQFAQRAASGAFDRFSQTQSWYQKYIEVLENVGWSMEQFAFSRFDQREGEFRMDQAALKIVTAIATQNQLAVLTASIGALEKLAEGDGTIKLFEFHASLENSGNFQLGAVQQGKDGILSMAMGGFYFKCNDERRRFLFVKWGGQSVHFWTAAQRMTFNRDLYAATREEVSARLESDASKYVAGVVLGKR